MTSFRECPSDGGYRKGAPSWSLTYVCLLQGGPLRGGDEGKGGRARDTQKTFLWCSKRRRSANIKRMGGGVGWLGRTPKKHYWYPVRAGLRGLHAYIHKRGIPITAEVSQQLSRAWASEGHALDENALPAAAIGNMIFSPRHQVSPVLSTLPTRMRRVALGRETRCPCPYPPPGPAAPSHQHHCYRRQPVLSTVAAASSDS